MVPIEGELSGADYYLLAVEGEGRPDAWLVPASDLFLLGVARNEDVYAFKIDVERDLLSATGLPPTAAELARLKVSVDGVVGRDFPERGAADQALAGCGRCPTASRRPPLLLTTGQSCPVPEWLPRTALGDRFDTVGKTAAIARRIRLELEGPCPCVPVSPPPRAEPMELDVAVVAPPGADQWVPRAVAEAADGSIGVFSERAFSHARPDGTRAADVTLPRGLEGPLLAASSDGQGGFLLANQLPGSLPNAVAGELMITSLDRALAQPRRALTAALVRPGVLRRFKSDRDVFLTGSIKVPGSVVSRPGIATCTPGERPTCEVISPLAPTWGEHPLGPPSGESSLADLVRMPDGLFVAVTEMNEVWFGARTASVPATSGLHGPGSQAEPGWRWRGMYARREAIESRYSVRCAPEIAAQCRAGETALVPTYGHGIARFGAWVVLCSRAVVPPATGETVVWARTATIGDRRDPGEGWTVLYRNAQRGLCDFLTFEDQRLLRVYSNREAMIDLREEGGRLVAQPPAPELEPDFAFGEPPTRVYDPEGPYAIAVAPDGRISRGEKRSRARYVQIWGPRERADEVRWEGPVIADGQRFLVFARDGQVSEVAVPDVGPPSTPPPRRIAALAGCGRTTAVAKDSATDELVLAGWWNVCNLPCSAATAGCPGPWLFRAKRDLGGGTRVPLGPELEASPITVMAEATPGTLVIAPRGSHTATIAGSEVRLPDAFVLRGDTLSPVEWPSGLDDPTTPEVEEMPEMHTDSGAFRCQPRDPFEYERPPARRQDDVWRSASASAGVVWLGGCDTLAVRVIGPRAERVARLRTSDAVAGTFDTAHATCPDQVIFGAGNTDPYDAGLFHAVGPVDADGTLALGEWLATTSRFAHFDIGIPTAITGSGADFLSFNSFDRPPLITYRSGASIFQSVGDLREYYPAPLLYAAADARGVNVATGFHGRVLVIRRRR